MRNQERKTVLQIVFYALSQLSIIAGLIVAAIYLPTSGFLAVCAAGGAMFLSGLFATLSERDLFELVKLIFGAIVLAAATVIHFLFGDILNIVYQCVGGFFFIALGFISFICGNDILYPYEIKKRYLFLLKFTGFIMMDVILIGIPMTIFLSGKFYCAAIVFAGCGIWLLRTVWYIYFFARYKYSQEKLRAREEARRAFHKYMANTHQGK